MSGSGSTQQPGPIYDNALRHLGQTELIDLLSYLGLDPGPGTAQMSGALPAATLHADLIADVGGGRLVHLEFVRHLEPDLVLRMLDYRARILSREKVTDLTQHILVVAGGTVVNPFADPPLGSQLTLQVGVTYLRDHDPEHLLTRPGLAPLAVLGRAGTWHAREEIFRRALTVISRLPDHTHRHALARIAATLAGIHLQPATIEKVTKEAAMPITLDEDTVAGRAIAAAAEARGEAIGRAIGRATTLASLLRRTFGDDPRIDAIARHLAELPQEQALDAALTATSLDDLEPSN